eukprot:376208_1
MSLITKSYVWEIKEPVLFQRIKALRSIESPVFKIHDEYWYLQCDAKKDHCNFYLYLAKRSPNTWKIHVRFNVSFIEGNISLDQTYTWCDIGYCGLKEYMSTNKLTEYNTTSFKVDITMFHKWDNNGKEISNGNDMKTNEKSSEIVTITDNSLESKMNKMLNTIKEMRQEINVLKEKINTENENDNDEKQEITEQQRLKIWFNEQVGLPQYFDVFTGNGIDNLSVAQLVTEKELETMSIKRLGDKMKILHAIDKLKQMNKANSDINNNCEEGNDVISTYK